MLDALSTPPLTRSRDGYVAGVCEGLSQRLGIEALWIRAAWLVAVLFFGTGLLAYLAFWWIVPREGHLPADPVVWDRRPDGQRRPPLRRTVHDRKLLGVCGGLARTYTMDPSVVRLLALSVATLSLGTAGLVYLIAAIVMPVTPALGAYRPNA